MSATRKIIALVLLAGCLFPVCTVACPDTGYTFNDSLVGGIYLPARSGKTKPRRALSDRPNVIIILTDDQGYGDFSCHGNPVLKTPALDKLHGESIRFSDFHVTPLCTPTRGELMSGLDALRNKASTVGAGRNILRRDISIMPEIFQQNGYQTGIFGKWHLGDNYPDRPIDRGFQKAVWFRGWGLLSESEYDNDYYRARYLNGTTTVQSEKYCTDLFFDESMKWMGEMAQQGKPFFTYLATNTPHGPFHSPAEDQEYYRNLDLDEKTAHFFGMIRNIDRNMAKLDKWLRENQLLENTLLIFLTDNGGTGGVDVYNAGLRGKKTSNYEGGHRAACFIRWPAGNLGTPRTISQPAQVQDILPTLVDLLGIETKRSEPFDGISLRRVLQSARKAPADRKFVVQYTEKSGPEKYFSCVLWNSWRLVGRDELYDVSRDPGQTKDVSGEYPSVVRKMRKFYETWWAALAPALPEFVPHLVGSSGENPVTLTSDFWMDSAYVNTQWKVAAMAGPPGGGTWAIDVAREGKYRITLSRWPFHLQRPLTLAGPAAAVGGTKLAQGRSVPVAAGCVSLDNAKPQTLASEQEGADNISMVVSIAKGRHTLRCWFRDSKGNDLCGAYYVKVERLESL